LWCVVLCCVVLRLGMLCFVLSEQMGVRHVRFVFVFFIVYFVFIFDIFCCLLHFFIIFWIFLAKLQCNLRVKRKLSRGLSRPESKRTSFRLEGFYTQNF